MLDAFRYLRASLSEFYYELPRMVLLNLIWFLFSLPLIFIAFVAFTVIRGAPPGLWAIFALQAVLPVAAALALAGPATAAVYYCTNRLAHGELLEVRQFWPAFRRFLWRGWLLALADLGLGLLLVLNVWFYWSIGQPGLWILSVIFAYLLVLWFMVQGYLFSLLVELNQPVRLVIRNALFMVIDKLGLTLGLTIVNLLIVLLSVLTPLAGLLLPLAMMVLLSSVNNKAVVEAVERYRAAGRIIPSEPQ